MRVVVTGASGNVGTSVLAALGRDAAVKSIIAIARRPTQLQFAGTTWQQADVRSDDLESLFAGADVVVHLAWLIQPSRDERITYSVNVEGSRRVFDAAAAAGVGALVVASSVGAYAAGPKDRLVDETWPTTGIPTSFYSRHKALTERRLDAFEAEHPEIRVVRLRPGLIFKREAASEIRRLFVGPFLPRALVRRWLIPMVPRVPGLSFQAVHADDVARAYALAVTGDARGAFNVAAEPVLDANELGRLFGARPVALSAALLRRAAELSWRARLQPTSPGWLDMALGVPIMDTTAARTELGWTPSYRSTDALAELFDGLREGAGLETPPLDPAAGGRLRVRELLTGVGGQGR